MRTFMRKTVLFVALFAASCSTTPRPAPMAAPAPATAQAGERPCNPGLALVNAAAWMQTAAEYRASALQVYAAARKALDAGLAAERGGVPPPAIILDLDETALDNGAFETRMIREGKTYDAKEWTKWISESAARPVPGAAEFLAYARSREVTPFYITNRKPEEEPATRRNLEKLGYPFDTNTLLMRDASNDKSARRDFVASRYRVLLVLGDDLNDFVNASGKNVEERATLIRDNADKWGSSWFILPNPMYGSWEAAVTGSGTDCEKMQRKIEALKP